MRSRRRLTAVLGAGAVVAAGLLGVVPAEAAPAGNQVVQSPGWKNLGVYTHAACFSLANEYHANGSRAERCDYEYVGHSRLWVLIDD